VSLSRLIKKAIALTLTNEYTDWSLASVEHSQNLMDSFVDILGDALVVAPLLNSANLHLRLHHSTSSSHHTSRKSKSNTLFDLHYMRVTRSSVCPLVARKDVVVVAFGSLSRVDDSIFCFEPFQVLLLP
jgi:hypothetical protein